MVPGSIPTNEMPLYPPSNVPKPQSLLMEEIEGQINSKRLNMEKKKHNAFTSTRLKYCCYIIILRFLASEEALNSLVLKIRFKPYCVILQSLDI